MPLAASPYWETLLRRISATPGLTLAEAQPESPSPFAVHRLHLQGPAAAREEFPRWLTSLGEIPALLPNPSGWTLIAPDGLVIVITLVTPGDEGAGGRAAASPSEELSGQAPRFWGALYLALGAVGRGCTFTAHGHLEECRVALLGLYRLALAPGDSAWGWLGLEGLPGAKALDGLKEWLVCPLEARAQWRCAHRIAAAAEGLLLPLSERLGLPYPWALRNLAFKRLDRVRPADRGAAGEQPELPELPATRDVDEPGGSVPPPGPVKVRVKVKIRRPLE